MPDPYVGLLYTVGLRLNDVMPAYKELAVELRDVIMRVHESLQSNYCLSSIFQRKPFISSVLTTKMNTSLMQYFLIVGVSADPKIAVNCMRTIASHGPTACVI